MRIRSWTTAALTAGLCAAAPHGAAAAPHDIVLASRAPGDAGAKADGGISIGLALSAGGRSVAFWSAAANLSPDDPDTHRDLYVRDLAKGATVLASRASGERGPKAAATFLADRPSLSADGRRVAFATDAANLSPADTDTHLDVFVRDLDTRETILVSRASGRPGAKADDESGNPVISGDGRYVAFTSSASNLAAEPVTQSHLYVRDLRTGTTTLESRASGIAGAPAGGGVLAGTAISADGRRVAFATRAGLVPEDDNRRRDVYVRDRPSGKTMLVSRAAGAAGAVVRGDSIRPSISADGRTVAFDSWAQLDPADGNAHSDVYVRALGVATTTLVSRSGAGAAGNDDSRFPAISADGSRIAFASQATNLSAAAGAVQNVYVRDAHGGAAPLIVSRAAGAGGAGGDDSSGGAAISADGRFVAFSSDATNLSAADPLADSDAYVRELPPSRFVLPGSVASAAAGTSRGSREGRALPARPPLQHVPVRGRRSAVVDRAPLRLLPARPRALRVDVPEHRAEGAGDRHPHGHLAGRARATHR